MWRHARELKREYEPTKYRNHWDDPAAADMAHAAFRELAIEACSDCSAATVDNGSDLVAW